MSANNLSRKETERTKLIQEKCQTLLTQMLRDEDNKYCVDCDAKGPRWASWNLGVFLCIRCAGMHRNLGVHISRVKSVNLDTWTPEQVISLQQMGNSRARAVYEAQLPDGFRRPQTNNALESFIRAKYEHKKYLAREWVPPSPPKVDWAKEIDEELERQKRKKKAAQANSVLGLGVVGSATLGGTSDKKNTGTGSNAVKSAPLPAPLPKPKPGQSGSSPKTQRLSISSNSADQQTNDLLGLSTPTKPTSQSSVGGNATQEMQNDNFSGFLSAPASVDPEKAGSTNNTTALMNSATQDLAASVVVGTSNNSLAKEEQDFFNQGSLVGLTTGCEKDKSGKLTKDSILSLYAAAPSHNPHNQQMQFGLQQATAQQQMYTQNTYGGIAVPHNNMNFTGMSPGFMGGAAAGGQAQQPQQQQHQQQFMTPPNSASMYNAPVMTAPNAFSVPGMGGSMQLGNAGVAAGGFGAQFPVMQHAGFNAQMPSANMMTQNMMSMGGGGIMATGQTAVASNGVHLMQANQSRLGGMPLGMLVGGGGGVGGVGNGLMQQQPQSLPQMTGGVGGLQTLGGIGSSMPIMGVGMPAAYQTSMTGSTATAASTGNLNQQFGNLNIGNVWQ